MQTGLTAFIIPAVEALSMEVPPGLGVALSTEIQMMGFQLTVPIASAEFSLLAEQGMRNSSRFHAFRERYDEIGSLNGDQADTGTGEMTSESSDLRDLSAKHSQIASDALSATNHTKHVWGQVAGTHGMVCLPAATALGDADMKRSSIGHRTAKTSHDLAEKLTRTAGHYDREDRQNADKISNEMRLQ